MDSKNPGILNRYLFLNTMPLSKYLDLLANMDLILDPFYFGSGTACMHAMAVGTPIITQPIDQMKSRTAEACYQLMGIENPPIAKNAQEYISLCLKLSESEEERKSLRRQILSKKDRIFNTSRCLDEMRQFITDAVKCAEKGVKLPTEWDPKTTLPANYKEIET